MSRDTISMSRPAPGEAGDTGSWRSARPVMVDATCTAVKQGSETCQLCWVYCPDACISRGIGPAIDLAYCKGCGICAYVCPTGAITMQPEREHGTCAMPEGGER